MKALKGYILVFVLIVLTAIVLFTDVDFKLRLTYVVFGIGLLAFLGFSLYTLITNLKQNSKSLIGAGIVLGVIVLFYFITPRNDVAMSLYEKTGTGFGWSPIIGAGLYSVYALLAIFVLLYIALSIRNVIK